MVVVGNWLLVGRTHPFILSLEGKKRGVWC